MVENVNKTLAAFGLILIVLGVVLQFAGAKLSTVEQGFLQYVPRFPDKLKAGELIYAQTGPEEGQIWDGFVFKDRSNVYLLVVVETWDNRTVESSIIPPTQKVWDFKTLNLKMPEFPAFFSVTIKYHVGQPISDEDFMFSEGFGVWIGLDGAYKYPLDYTGFRFKVYGVTFENQVLTVDVEFYPRTPDIGEHAVYAGNFSIYERWNVIVKVADLKPGRNTYTLALSDLTYVKISVYGVVLYIPKSQFGTVATPPPPSTGETPAPPNESPPASRAGLVPTWLAPLLMVAGVVLVAASTRKH